jgi:hypothetical protein
MKILQMLHINRLFNYVYIKKTFVFTDKLMKLKNIILSECSQAQKAKGSIFSLISGR